MLPPPPPPPSRPSLFDQADEVPPPPPSPVARRQIVVNGPEQIHAQYFHRMRLLDIFSRVVLVGFLVIGLVLFVRWAVSSPADYRDPEPPPPTTTAPPLGG